VIVLFVPMMVRPGIGFLLLGILLSLPSGLFAAQGIVQHELDSSPKTIREYWTPARMEDALKHPASNFVSGAPVVRSFSLPVDPVKVSPSSCPGCVETHSMPDPMPRLPSPEEKIACPVTRYDWKFDTSNEECKSSSKMGHV